LRNAVWGIALAAVTLNIVESPAFSADDRATPEYQLAMLNANGAVNSSDVTIIRFRYILNSIQDKSGESHRRIGDMLAKGHSLLRSNYGKQVSVLSFAEDANRAMRSAPSGTAFAEVVALLVISIGRS
jgi:hypothetical protein